MSKDDKSEAQHQPDQSEQGVEFAQRRKVVRGLASIPVAFTLSSGAALANTSFHACVNTTPVETVPDCSTNENDLSGWMYKFIKPNYTNGDQERFCVAYAEEKTAGVLDITGYNYKKNPGDTTTFIGPDGEEVIGGLSGNPLRASCATSFMN